MGDPAKDKEALGQLEAIRKEFVQKALDGFKSSHAEMKATYAKLDAAVHERNAELIQFQYRRIQALDVRLGTVVGEIDMAIDALNDFAGDPDMAAAQDPAAKLVRGLGAARKELGQWLAKANKLEAKAATQMQVLRQRAGGVEAAWAKLQAVVAESAKLVRKGSDEMLDVGAAGVAAARKLDGTALEEARKKAETIAETNSPQYFVDDSRKELAEFEKQLKDVKPKPEFVVQFKRERAQLVDEIDSMQARVKEMERSYGVLSLMKVQLDFRKIAEALGVPPDEAAKIGPALSMGGSATLKALDIVARKHDLAGSPKDLLATLQKRGLVGRA